ncbi:hypothetical protein FOQG_07772 [Fusarium oxysporum f. sp. raphani 54005]|uniref:Uncharacterized protein n=1 Tax=Fusarium oxysporum f. sp. raphani 54005 TaxID=1089458 RepID=X0C5R3_FUSOX|nr:hypothetical protein FOQG_07772 [Fusarium oxysporum f. sp. raphani 54005]KAJ4052928.1 hypothetical protein NW753_007104 [Fusarium oxysporum]KAJ4054276.1 hypothetical protein NW763_007833 [Fusarium oxysporum]KAJ4087514.1 hypothetical protein NW756_007655 [Fusarium oxysporum]KAJ4115761.1 hypothetical protein NW769_004387 [Fusarium oxysporum]
MPRRWFSNRLHHAWGRVAGRHGRQRDQERQSPQHFAEIVTAPDQSPDRANHLRRGASLPDLLTCATLGGIAQLLPLDSESLWDAPTPAPSPVQSQSNGAIGLGTFLGELEREASREDQHFIPTAIITTRDTGSIGTGIEDQPWMLPGQDFFPESQPPVPSHLRTGLFLSSQPKHRTLEPCDCCSPKTLAGDWRALTPDPLTHTFTRHESLASCSELRGRDHSKSQDKAFAVPISVITIEYYEFRSEEAYRAWLVVSKDGRLRDYLSPSEAVTLYIYLVPNWWWSNWIHDYDEKFIEDTNIAWAYIEGVPGSRFEQVFQSFFSRTRLGLHSWTGSAALSGGDQSSVTKTESQEEALQGSGNQPEGALTLYGDPFQGTRKAPHQKHPPVSGGDLEETLRGFQGGPRQWALDALFSGAPGGSENNQTPGTQGAPFTGALGDMREFPRQALDALFSGAPRGSNSSRKPGAQDVPTTGALDAVQVSQHWALDALFTGGAREILDESVQGGVLTGVPEGSDYDQMRGDQDVPRIVPPVAVSDISASSERDIRRIRRETAVLSRVD